MVSEIFCYQKSIETNLKKLLLKKKSGSMSEKNVVSKKSLNPFQREFGIEKIPGTEINNAKVWSQQADFKISDRMSDWNLEPTAV